MQDIIYLKSYNDENAANNTKHILPGFTFNIFIVEPHENWPSVFFYTKFL